jgi:1-acyl-sn-glycerol-3-phosphate acyltransferase
VGEALTSGWRPPRALDRAAFAALKLAAGGALRLAFRVRAVGVPRLDGAYVLAANHTSLLDPVLLGVVCPRRIVFLMTAVFHRSTALGWFYRWMRAIPLAARGNNQAGLRAARAALAAGQVVGIFPEGGISRDGRLLLGNPGAVALVLAQGVPVVPVGIAGAERALGFGRVCPRPVRVTIRFGAPIAHDELLGTGPRKTRLRDATLRLMREIAVLSGQRAREDELGERRANREPN